MMNWIPPRHGTLFWLGCTALACALLLAGAALLR